MNSPPAPTKRRWIIWSIRLASTAHLAGVLGQAALAGLFVTGDANLLHWHEVNSINVRGLLLLQIVAAVLVRRPGRGPVWPAWLSGLLLVVEEMQAGLGYVRMLALHIPLGVVVFGVSAALTAWTWWGLRRTPREDDPQTAPHEDDQKTAPREENPQTASRAETRRKASREGTRS
ncbi:hypothetical protein [Streptosporangium sp. KLBMP 9127]|nr:hypothetical protein [Streptosporangium sp. KLBMP 9127]